MNDEQMDPQVPMPEVEEVKKPEEETSTEGAPEVVADEESAA